VVDRVFIHIGLPKTATSYLQTIVWSNRDRLREAGVVVPGRRRTDHLWASREVRGDPNLERAPEAHRTAWTRLRRELSSSSGTGLISHEFFAAASERQARDLVTALGDAEVHVVVTAREPLGLFTASWQESLKNGSTTHMADYGRRVSKSPTAIWNWRTLDLKLVLQRWSQAVPPGRIHVLVLDPRADRDDIWRRFAGLLGVDPDACDLSQSFPNTSMGVAEAETLRRINMRLEGFDRAFDKGVYIRTFLADERLVPRKGEKFWPEPDQVEDCRRRARSAASYLQGSGFDVSGRVEHLLVPDELEHRRLPASVTDAEVAEVAVGLAATMLGDVRALRTALRQRPPQGRIRRYAARGRRAVRRLRDVLRRRPS
jgi:hypothetical protein